MKKSFLIIISCLVCYSISHAQTLPKDPYVNKTEKITIQLGNTHTLNPKSSLGITDTHLLAGCSQLSGDVSAFEIVRGEKISPYGAKANHNVKHVDGYYYEFKVKPLKAGTFTLKGSCSYVVGFGPSIQSNKTITYTITVPQVESITIPSTKTLKVGDSYTFSPKVIPSNVSTSFKWITSDKTIVTVNTSGKISAKKVGTATITCQANNGVKATCKVTVKPVTVSNITLNNSTFSLNTGESYQLKATISPSNAANKNVKWQSSNPSVATVSSTGLVTALTLGDCTIIVTATDGSNVTASCELSVSLSVVTTIHKVENGSMENKENVYNLNGQKLNRTSQNGIFIVNGRKVAR